MTTIEAPIKIGRPLGLSTNVALADGIAGARLSPQLQDRARRYVSARTRSGVALLEAVAELAAARSEAQHGEWQTFLDAIGLDDSAARAQIRIHEAAESDSAFAEKIRTGWLSEATARELLPAPPEIRAEILARPDPPTQREIKAAKREALPVLNPDPLPDDDLELDRGERWTSTAHKAAENNDRALLIRAEQEIAGGDYATARGLLNQVGDTSSRARDRLLERLPPAQTAIDLDPLADVLQLMEHVHGSSPHRPTAIRAALELASALASGPLEDWIDQLDDQCYETLACWRRDRSVPA